MKKVFICITMAFIFSNLAVAQEKTDSIKIVECVKNYIEGWFNGDVVRMDKALHPDFIKHSAKIHTDTGGSIIETLSKSQLLEYTKSGYGKQTPRDKAIVKVDIFEINTDFATAKSWTPEFYDYIHLVKFNGEWKILNVLYGFNKK